MNNNNNIISRTDYVHTDHPGIDYLTLHTRDFTVLSTAHLTISTAIQAGEQKGRLLFTYKNQDVYGQGAYLKTEHYGLDINSYGLRVQFNPSKLLHPYELLSDEETLLEVIKQTEQFLLEKGIIVKLLYCNLTRVDLAKQAIMPHKVSAYQPAFEHLGFKPLRAYKENYYNQTFGIYNKSVSLTFYDKLSEIKKQELDSNYMRCELKLLKSQSIQTRFKIRTLKEFIALKKQGWNELFCKELNKALPATTQTFATHDNLLEQLANTFGREKRNGLQKALAVLGVQSINEKFGGIDKFLSPFNQYHSDKTNGRNRQYLLDLTNHSHSLISPVPSVNLINELKTQFL